MITTLGIIDIIYKRLKITDLLKPLNGGINGGMYKMIRPINSKYEDVVINCLPVSNDMIQKATVNVNIYVPDIKAKFQGDEQSLPDMLRLEQLTQMAISLLSDVHFPSYFYEIESQKIFQEVEINQHFSNLRIQFKKINL